MLNCLSPNQPFSLESSSSLLLQAPKFRGANGDPSFPPCCFLGVVSLFGGVLILGDLDSGSGTSKSKEKSAWTNLCSCLYGLDIVHSKKVTHHGSHAKPTFWGCWPQYSFPLGHLNLTYTCFLCIYVYFRGWCLFVNISRPWFWNK